MTDCSINLILGESGEIRGEYDKFSRREFFVARKSECADAGTRPTDAYHRPTRSKCTKLDTAQSTPCQQVGSHQLYNA